MDQQKRIRFGRVDLDGDAIALHSAEEGDAVWHIHPDRVVAFVFYRDVRATLLLTSGHELTLEPIGEFTQKLMPRLRERLVQAK